MLANRIVRLFGVLCALVALAALASSSAEARPAYAKKEGKMCIYCHVQPGGDRNFRGLYYHAHAKSFVDFDNVYEAKAAGVKPNSMGPDAVPTVAGYPSVKAPAALDFTMKDIDGKPVKLARYKGDVIMVINVRPECGNTPQYDGLEKIYEKYKDQGFTILAFPANDFGKQEPGDEEDHQGVLRGDLPREVPALLQDRRQGRGEGAALQIPHVPGHQRQIRRRDRLELRQVPHQPQGRGDRPLQGRR